MQTIKNVIDIAAEHNGGSKRTLLTVMASGLCEAIMCAGIDCSACPFNNGASLQEALGELAEELA